MAEVKAILIKDDDGVMPTIAIAHADQAGGAMIFIDTWAVELAKYAQEIGYDVIDISGHDLEYQRMTAILKETNPAILFYFGLGDKAHLIGNDILNIVMQNRAHELISVSMYSNRKSLTYLGDPNWKLRRN